MAENILLRRPRVTMPAVSIIGMAGSGKTTTGKALSSLLGWAFMDTDHLIEATYGARLQDITDALPREQFLDLERSVIITLRASRCVVSTGGSSVYRPESMEHLHALGPVICLDAPFSVIRDRIARNPDRGLVIAGGQTLRDLYEERKILYNRYADIHCDATMTPSQCALWIQEHLPAECLATER